MDNTADVSDVFSLSDHLLAERLQFVKEIGFGNWGSVWLCRPKSSSGKVRDMEVAVKLVHRSKTSTTAARVRSLWNEMKIVRSFKNDPHPSIVPFHSFIITPSYALITMAFLPTLVPVEVSEPRAKEWFKSLLSGVYFLHSRGVVHNDIKPANILLSRANVPVLVDFGFAEKYDLTSPKAFHSNLTYGTPEYLSPERARGLPHDTRKSDVWSLGITFFEILVGRTPFEYEEGEVFEKKEDLEKYWNRTMRGKWVGKYSVSLPIERLLKRMVVPNADLRCTAADLIADPYWDADPVTPGHRKSTSAVVLSSAHTRKSSLFNTFKESFRDKEKEKEPSFSRLLEITLPWSASKSTPRFPASRPASRNESRPASRIAMISRPASRTGTSRVASATSSVSQTPTPNSIPDTQIMSDRRAIMEQASRSTPQTPVRTRTHSRSKSQPKLRSPSGIITSARTRKLSTVQASPIVRPQPHLAETESSEKDASVAKVQENAKALKPQALISLSSNPSMRRPLGPRQPSTRVASISAANGGSSPSNHLWTPENKCTRSRPVQPQTPDAHTSPRRVTPRSVPQTPTRSTSCQTPQTGQSRQLSGKPPRTRGRAAVLADLTGHARNVDSGVHGIGHPVKRGAEKRERGKEHAKGRTNAQKENKENEIVPTPVHTSRKDSRVPSRVSRATPLSPKTPVKEKETSPISTPLVSNLSGAMTVTRGSVRDRMMDWERERARLREMNELTDTSTDGHDSTSTSPDSSDDDSSVEAEVVAAVASAQAKSKLPTEFESSKEVVASVEVERPTTTQTVATASSSVSNLESSQIAIAKIGVRTSAQILSPRNGSVTPLGHSQSMRKQSTGGSQTRSDTVTDIGLPIEVRRSESGLSTLKHSVKASIDKGVRFCKSSTLAQITGRATPVWCSSPEPIDFEQRRSGEDGRFSWEDIRPEHEVAVDRMNMWIQSVEKVVEETCQNFASTSVTPPAPLPLASFSRSSMQHHGPLTASTSATQIHSNDTTLNPSRSSRPPRRLLAANEIFAEPTDVNAPLSPPPSREEDADASSSYILAPESSVPVLPPVSMQTPRRRRATISTRSPVQTQADSTTSDIFDNSPSKRREKSKSQSNLDRHIKDVAKLELELSKAPVSSPSTELSAVLDRSLFVAPPLSPRFTEDVTATHEVPRGRIQFNALDSSPYLVEAQAPRKSGEQVIIESPDKRHLEGVYDRFLMATSGVKRVGKGYQSDKLKPVHNILNTAEQAKANHARGFGGFGTAKRPMPPPVSSEDPWMRSTPVDGFGFVIAGQRTNTSSTRTSKDENKATFVRRAIKAMVPGRASVARRMSRTIAV